MSSNSDEISNLSDNKNIPEFPYLCYMLPSFENMAQKLLDYEPKFKFIQFIQLNLYRDF